jgi:hypothetical protein
MMFTRRHHRQEVRTAFDHYRNLPPNLTYTVPIGRGSCYRSQIPTFSIAPPSIMQMAHYPNWPGSQSLIIVSAALDSNITQGCVNIPINNYTLREN